MSELVVAVARAVCLLAASAASMAEVMAPMASALILAAAAADVLMFMMYWIILWWLLVAAVVQVKTVVQAMPTAVAMVEHQMAKTALVAVQQPVAAVVVPPHPLPV